jgi:hypothetical protein
VRQFDVSKRSKGEEIDDSKKALQELAEGEEIEERITQQQQEGDEEDDHEDDYADGWSRERETMSSVDRKALDESLRPVWTLLVKVGFTVTDVGAKNDKPALIALQNLVLDNPFKHDCLATVECDVRKTQACSSNDAARRKNPMEFYI